MRSDDGILSVPEESLHPEECTAAQPDTADETFPVNNEGVQPDNIPDDGETMHSDNNCSPAQQARFRKAIQFVPLAERASALSCETQQAHPQKEAKIKTTLCSCT